jgi:starch phosphorylase
MDQKRINEAADDPVFLGTMNRVLSAFDSYHAEPSLQLPGKPPLQATDLIAYFCAEFGFHESLPIYSGGLGILAGDHCKGASDLRLPFVAVGLLYRQGYFRQTIDRDGNGRPRITATTISTTCRSSRCAATTASELRVGVDFPGRTVWAKIWRARVGNNSLYLLDTQLEENSEADREIAHQLYGGDRRTRIEQEILLGVGGVRALAALGLQPTVWHINEGHAAFLVLERIRELVAARACLSPPPWKPRQPTRCSPPTPRCPPATTTFADDMVMHYFGEFCKAAGLDRDGLLGMGRVGGGVAAANST